MSKRFTSVSRKPGTRPTIGSSRVKTWGSHRQGIEAVNMVKQLPELRAVLKKRRNDLYFSATASFFEALVSDSNTLDGLNSHAVIIDELHAIKDRNLYEVMKQSTSSRRQPLVVMITTAGTVRESVFDEMYELACKIADGTEKDPTFLC